MIQLRINIQNQKLYVNIENALTKIYHVSTAAKGIGQQAGSEQTPIGWHEIRAKIGKEYPVNTVFVDRRPTGEIFSSSLRLTHPERDWILTRILWLSGLEKGKNRLYKVDTMRRYIYLHGSPDDVEMGNPGSRGCIRMRNSDIIELFDLVLPGTRVLIEKE